MAVLNIETILQQLDDVTKELTGYCSHIDSASFFRQPEEKWSIAQNVQHLTTSAKSTTLAYSLPKFIERLYAGKPNRPSRSYEELQAKYNLKLEQGGKASKQFVPDRIYPETGKEKLMKKYTDTMVRLILIIRNKWKDPQLDEYIAPHPLLGKITLRELCYFTIFHTEHHLNTIKSLAKV